MFEAKREVPSDTDFLPRMKECFQLLQLEPIQESKLSWCLLLKNIRFNGRTSILTKSSDMAKRFVFHITRNCVLNLKALSQNLQPMQMGYLFRLLSQCYLVIDSSKMFDTKFSNWDTMFYSKIVTCSSDNFVLLTYSVGQIRNCQLSYIFLFGYNTPVVFVINCDILV